MKHSCEIVQDLLPLYYDRICSKESKVMVETHLAECPLCRATLEKMKNTVYDESLREEKINLVERYTKKIRRKSYAVGMAIASTLAIPIIVCLIVNLATGHGLDWFFIVFTSVLVAGSVTVVPLLVAKEKLCWTLLSFTGSIMLLLMTCCIYTGGDWFALAAIPILFGLSLVFLPIVLNRILKKGRISRCKGLISMAVDTVLLYAVIFVCGLYSGSAGYWHTALTVTSFCLALPWVYFVVIRYFKVNGWIKAAICCVFGANFLSFVNGIVQWTLGEGFQIWIYNINLLAWNSDDRINANVYFLIFITGCILGIIFFAIGVARHKKANSGNIPGDSMK